MLTRRCLQLGLILCIYAAGKLGVSAWYLDRSTVSGLESAIYWAPSNAQNFDDLGNLIHFYGDGADPERIVEAYRNATRLSPQNALYWADLGFAYDWLGKPVGAAAAFRRAQQLFPNSPDLNWRLANFWMRQGNSAAGLQCLRKVLVAGVVPRRDVFALAASAGVSNQTIIAELLPPEGPIFVDYLNFLIQRDDMAAASEVWRRLPQSNMDFSLSDGFAYFDALIQHRRLPDLDDVASTLAKTFPSQVHYRRSGSNLVTNGSFEDDILNGGFDWRIIPVEGARVSQDSEHRLSGSRSLRIDFEGTQNPYYFHCFQYVPVKPGTRYHFSGYMQVKGVTTDSGPTFEIYDPYDTKKLFLSGRRMIGTSDWSLQEFDFKTKPGNELLVVRVGRPPSEKFANKIGGTVWISRIRLEETPETRRNSTQQLSVR